MSWRDRPYASGEDGGWPPGGGGVRFGLPKPTRLVVYLLIINVGVFVLTIVPGLGDFLRYYGMMAVGPTYATGGGVLTGQIWRLVTYQYLHSTAGATHLFFNMLGLYFLGPPLERRWGPKTFFVFYTACGVAGALLYIVLVVVGFLEADVMLGASGSVLGLLAGCAVLMPGMVIILLFFPVPIRFAAALFVGLYVLNLMTAFASDAGGAGGDAAHLGGMAFGAVWCLWGWDWLGRRRERAKQGSWERRMQQQQDLDREVDRILAKVHEHGIQSLTRHEKRLLSEATEAQRRQEQQSRRL